MNRKRMLAGLAATGIVAGAVAGGGVALASSGPAQATNTAVTTAATDPADWCGYGIGPMYGMRDGQQPVLTAAASYLGLTQTQLRDQLQAGKSLADVATAQGKSVSGLKNAILAAVTTRINANTRLTAAQKTTLIAEAKSHLDAMVNATHPVGAGMRWADSPMRGDGPLTGGRGMGMGMGMGHMGGW